MWPIVFVLCSFLLIYYCWNLRPPRFPPGPTILPIVGAAPFVTLNRIYLFMEQARKKYGPIVGTKIGMRNTVFFCSPKHVLEIFKIDEFQGRPRHEVIASVTANQGIILTDGNFWSVQRRFTLRHLKDFGFGKTSTEVIILEEIEELFENAFYNKEIIQATNIFNISAINVLWTLMAGKRYPHDDKFFKILLDALHQTFRNGGFTDSLTYLRRYFRAMLGIPEKTACNDTLHHFIMNAIEEHRQNPTEEPRDFIDVYLKEIEQRSNPDFNDLSLISICIDLFIAGAESTGSTLSFCLLYMILYPDIQEEVATEVELVLGRQKPALTDRSRLPKVEAFLSEVSRINTISPIPVPRRTMTDVEYDGYLIPKDTFVVLSMWAVFKDEEHWGDPEVFRPWRFLDQDGKYVKDDWLITFGIGKRSCLGESLAKGTMFLMLVRLFQEFQFSLPEGNPTPSTLGQTGLTSTPEPFEVKIRRRI